VDDGVSPRDFTIPTFAARLNDAGDLWRDLRKAKGINLKMTEPPAPAKKRTSPGRRRKS
jgi:hypothetical protein